MQGLLKDAHFAKLDSQAKKDAAKYQSNLPFAHLRFDDFLPVEAGYQRLSKWPSERRGRCLQGYEFFQQFCLRSDASDQNGRLKEPA